MGGFHDAATNASRCGGTVFTMPWNRCSRCPGAGSLDSHELWYRFPYILSAGRYLPLSKRSRFHIAVPLRSQYTDANSVASAREEDEEMAVQRHRLPTHRARSAMRLSAPFRPSTGCVAINRPNVKEAQHTLACARAWNRTGPAPPCPSRAALALARPKWITSNTQLSVCTAELPLKGPLGARANTAHDTNARAWYRGGGRRQRRA